MSGGSAAYEEMRNEVKRLALRANAYDVRFIGLVRDPEAKVTGSSSSVTPAEVPMMILALVSYLHRACGEGPLLSETICRTLSAIDWSKFDEVPGDA